jgi:hypothetical protein
MGIEGRKMKNSALHRAVIAGDAALVKKLCSEDRNAIQVPGRLGYSALDLAKLLGKRDCLAFMSCGQKVTRYENETLGIKYLSHLKFKNYNQLKELIRNCPWIIKYSPLGQINRHMGDLWLAELQKGYHTAVKVQWIDENLGYGLFTKEAIEEGEYVGEYTGVIKRLERRGSENLNPYCFHYPTRFFSWYYYYIDALEEGNEMRYINHSDSPNLEPRCLYDRGLLHLVFFAKRAITGGAELTFDYGADFWRERKQFKR